MLEAQIEQLQTERDGLMSALEADLNDTLQDEFIGDGYKLYYKETTVREVDADKLKAFCKKNKIPLDKVLVTKTKGVGEIDKALKGYEDISSVYTFKTRQKFTFEVGGQYKPLDS